MRLNRVGMEMKCLAASEVKNLQFVLNMIIQYSDIKNEFPFLMESESLQPWWVIILSGSCKHLCRQVLYG
jgi:hypothetical protein